MPRTPIADGFRAAFRGPGLWLAEIGWRWCFGLTAWVLIALTFREWLASIRFTSAQWRLLQTRQPVLIARTIADALHGTGARLIEACIIVTLALIVFWIFAASVGRAATLKALLPAGPKKGFASLIALQFFRAALLLAAFLGLIGVAVLAGRAAPVDVTDTSALMARALGVLLFAVLVGFLWSVVNWFLSLAPIFVLRDGRDTFGAIADSWDFFRRHAAALVGVTFIFDLIRAVLLVLAALIATSPILGVQRSSEVPPALWFALGVSLVYFAVADFLYITRLAVFVNFAEQDLEPAPAPLPDQPSAPLATPVGPAT